jgi:hypothetical protein
MAGYGDQELGGFARSVFESYQKDGTASQNRDCSAIVTTLLVNSPNRTDYESEYYFAAKDLKGSIRGNFNTLCRALPSSIPKLLDYRKYKADGSLLDFEN